MRKILCVSPQTEVSPGFFLFGNFNPATINNNTKGTLNKKDKLPSKTITG